MKVDVSRVAESAACTCVRSSGSFPSIRSRRSPARMPARCAWLLGDDRADLVSGHRRCPHQARRACKAVDRGPCGRVGGELNPDQRSGAPNRNVEGVELGRGDKGFELIREADRLGVDRQQNIPREEPGDVRKVVGPHFTDNHAFAAAEVFSLAFRQHTQTQPVSAEQSPFEGLSLTEASSGRCRRPPQRTGRRMG